MNPADITIRGSRGPIAEQCLGFLDIGNYVATSEASSAIADAGREVHEALANWILTGKDPDDGVAWYQAFDSMRAVVERSRFAPLFTPENQYVEQEVFAIHPSGIMLPGRPDLFGIIPETKSAQIYDYKSGWNMDKDHRAQLIHYAYAIAEEFNLDYVKAYLLRRDTSVQPWRWTRDYLKQYFDDLADRIKRWDGMTFVDGDHCRYCPRKFDCPGLKAKTEMAVAAFASSNEVVFDITKPDTWKPLYDLAGLVEKAAKGARDAVKKAVADMGGKVVLEDGTIIELREIMSKKLEPGIAWDILINGVNGTDDDGVVTQIILPPVLTYEALIQCVEISTSKVEEAIKETLPRGQKKEGFAAIFEKLVEYGAVKEVPFQTRIFFKKGEK